MHDEDFNKFVEQVNLGSTVTFNSFSGQLTTTGFNTVPQQWTWIQPTTVTSSTYTTFGTVGGLDLKSLPRGPLVDWMMKNRDSWHLFFSPLPKARKLLKLRGFERSDEYTLINNLIEMELLTIKDYAAHLFLESRLSS